MQHIRVLVSQSELFLYKILTRFSIDMALEFNTILLDSAMEEQITQPGSEKADVVILSYHMPPTRNHLALFYETCRQIISIHHCHIILVCDESQFTKCYTYLQNVVDSFLLKPFLVDNIYSVLRKTVSMIANAEPPATSQVTADDLHTFFLSQTARIERTTPVTCEYYNRVYKTNLADGLYQNVFIKWEHAVTFLNAHPAAPSSNHNIHLRIQEIVSNELSPICHELLFSKLYDGVSVLLNYKETHTSSVLHATTRILSHIRAIMTDLPDFHVTICVGHACRNINDLANTFRTAHMASWQRRFIGVDRVIICSEEPDILPASGYEELNMLSAQIMQSISSLDSAQFRLLVRKVFALPTQVLISDEAKRRIIHWRKSLFDLHREQIRLLDDPNDYAMMLQYEMSFSPTFVSFSHIYETQLAALIDRIKGVIETRCSPPVAIAVEYIRNHYAKKISLHEMAQIVHLNANYFSNLFKKEMNIGFSAYLRDYRLQIAKELLSHSQMKLGEIADSVGFTLEYFGKCFRESEGISPTEYRKAYWQNSTLILHDTGLQKTV